MNAILSEATMLQFFLPLNAPPYVTVSALVRQPWTFHVCCVCMLCINLLPVSCCIVYVLAHLGDRIILN